MGTNSSQFLAARHRQFLRLRNVGERESVVAVFVLSPLKGVIVFVPARANPLAHCLRLIRRWLSPVLVGAPEEHLLLPKKRKASITEGSGASKGGLVFRGGKPSPPPAKSPYTSVAGHVNFKVCPLGPIGACKIPGSATSLAIHASDELEALVHLGTANHLVLAAPAHALDFNRRFFALRHGLAFSSITPIYGRNRSISSVGLIHGNTQGSPRRLRPSCALGVRHQTAREGVRRRSHQAPGGNIPIVKGLKSAFLFYVQH